MAASGSLLSLALLLLFIPSGSGDAAKKKNKDSESSSSVMNLSAIARAASSPGVPGLLAVKLACAVPIGVLQSMFSAVAMEQFGLPPEQNGYLMSYIGAISLVMQGAGIPLVTKRLSDRSVMAWSAAALALCYAALVPVSGVWGFAAILLPLTCALCLVNSVLTAAITKLNNEDTSDEKRSGTLLGLNMAVHSAVRAAAPTLGGAMVTGSETGASGSLSGFASIGALGVGCHLAALAMLPGVEALNR